MLYRPADNRILRCSIINFSSFFLRFSNAIQWFFDLVQQIKAKTSATQFKL